MKKKKNKKKKHNKKKKQEQKITSKKSEININENLNKSNEFICPLCHKKIEKLQTSIKEKYTQQPAHFDCIIKQLTKKEVLHKHESICYVGGGNFAVIKTKFIDKNNFSIIKKIPYEARNPYKYYLDEGNKS